MRAGSRNATQLLKSRLVSLSVAPSVVNFYVHNVTGAQHLMRSCVRLDLVILQLQSCPRLTHVQLTVTHAVAAFSKLGMVLHLA